MEELTIVFDTFSSVDLPMLALHPPCTQSGGGRDPGRAPEDCEGEIPRVQGSEGPSGARDQIAFVPSRLMQLLLVVVKYGMIHFNRGRPIYAGGGLVDF